MKHNILKSSFFALSLATLAVSCNSSDNADGGGNVIANPVTNDATALSTVNGVYSNWQPLSSSFTFVIELNSNKMISFEGEESEA